MAAVKKIELSKAELRALRMLAEAYNNGSKVKTTAKRQEIVQRFLDRAETAIG